MILLSLREGSPGSVHAAVTLTKLPNSLDSVGPISLQAISASRTANSKTDLIAGVTSGISQYNIIM